MAKRSERLESIAATIADYRAGEVPQPTPDHVDRWVRQFPDDVQRPILRELDHVLKETYFNRETVVAFLADAATTVKLVGDDPASFWREVNFLDAQQHGHSQAEMLEMFGAVLHDTCGLDIAECGSTNGPYVYLDDAIFTGSRIGSDLEEWITESAPPQATVHVIVIALHALGEYQVSGRLKKVIETSGKHIEIKYWRARNIENRRAYRNNAEVLWPCELPEAPEVAAYTALPQKFPWEPRAVGGKLGPFSSEAGRQVLEREFLLAGLKIRAGHANPSASLRPLGFSPFGMGFGSLTVTFRNCPNNAPLALWWGNIDGGGPAHFNNWYPLFPRKGYGDGGFDAFLA